SLQRLLDHRHLHSFPTRRSSDLASKKDGSKTDLASFNLTERQREIIELVKQGKNNRQIAELLFISENTVKYHLKVIYNILNISQDRKSTRLNSSHVKISYAVFCL